MANTNNDFVGGNCLLCLNLRAVIYAVLLLFAVADKYFSIPFTVCSRIAQFHRKTIQDTTIEIPHKFRSIRYSIE